jgi:hypothetical protein
MSGGKKRKGKGGQGSFKWGLLMGLAALSLAYWPINPHLKDPHSLRELWAIIYTTIIPFALPIG